MRSWIKLKLDGLHNIISPSVPGVRTHCYYCCDQWPEPRSQLSKYHCFIFGKFADSVHNKEVVPQSKIFAKLMKTDPRYSISRRNLNVNPQIWGHVRLLRLCVVPVMVMVMVPGSVQSLNHDQTIFVFIRAGTPRARNKRRNPNKKTFSKHWTVAITRWDYSSQLPEQRSGRAISPGWLRAEMSG